MDINIKRDELSANEKINGEKRVSDAYGAVIGRMDLIVAKGEDYDEIVDQLGQLERFAKDGNVVRELPPIAELGAGPSVAPNPGVTPEQQHFLELIEQKFGGDLTKAAKCIADSDKNERENARLADELQDVTQKRDALQNSLDGEKEDLRQEKADAESERDLAQSERDQAEKDRDAYRQQLRDANSTVDRLRGERNSWRDAFQDPNEFPAYVVEFHNQLGDNATQKGSLLNGKQSVTVKIPIDDVNDFGKGILKVKK